MKFLITGGAGFIGSNFIHYMSKAHKNDELVIVDLLTYAGSLDSIAPIINGKNIRFYRADICDRAEIYRIFEAESPDTVVNFAAESHVDRSIASPEIFLKTNVIGTEVLLDASLKYGVSRFHQISTDEVYGDLPLDRRDLKFTEVSPLSPSSPYSASKASADLLVLAYRRTYGLPVTLSRSSNNYGPYQHPEKLIPRMIAKALRGDRLPVFGNGLNVRDWIHVSDHCRAVDMICRNGKVGEIYNIGGGCELSNIEIVKMICGILNVSEDLIEYVPDRPGHDMRYAVDFTKLQNELGWRPMTDLMSGMKDTVEFYLSHPERLENTV